MTLVNEPQARTDECAPSADIRAALAQFLNAVAPDPDPSALTDEAPLLASGRLDSLAVVQLMEFLADELGVEISDDDFTVENFATAGSLVRLIEAKRAGIGT